MNSETGASQNKEPREWHDNPFFRFMLFTLLYYGMTVGLHTQMPINENRIAQKEILDNLSLFEYVMAQLAKPALLSALTAVITSTLSGSLMMFAFVFIYFLRSV